MKLFLSPFSPDVILLSDAIHQKLKQRTDNFSTCGSCIRSTRRMNCESFQTFYLSVITFDYLAVVWCMSTNKEQEN